MDECAEHDDCDATREDCVPWKQYFEDQEAEMWVDIAREGR